MNIIHIAFYTIKRYVIDMKALLTMVAFPLLLILILGISLNSTFGTINYEKIKIEVYSSERQNFNDFTNFIKSQNYNNIFIEKAVSKEKGINEVKNGEITAFVAIETLQNSNKIISTYVYKKDNLECSIVENLVNSYKNKPAGSVKLSSLDNSAVDNTGKYPRAIDYYAVTMLVMIVFYAAEECSSLLGEDFCTDVKNRVKSLPVKKMEIILGKIFGTTFSVFIWIGAVVLITKFVYRVNWGDNLLFIFCCILLVSFLSANLGASIFFITRDSDTANYIVQAMVPVFTFLSGGYVPLSYVGKGLEKFSWLSPSFAIQNIIFNNIYSGYCENVKTYYLEIIGMLVITSVIVTILGRRAGK